ncbi:hypothetical protein XPA_001792 [Xanthoria parietina]
MTCVQLYQIQLSKTVEDPPFTKFLGSFANAPGLVKVVWASQHEDDKFVGVAAQWSKYEAYSNWNTPEQTRISNELLQNVSNAPVYSDVVVFPEDAGSALAAPVVELVSWIYPAAKINADAEKTIAEGFYVFANAIMSEAPEAAGRTVGGWGQVPFDHEGTSSKRYTALIGWKSVEAHYACKKTPPFLDNIDHIGKHGHTGLEMAHYAYSQ